MEKPSKEQTSRNGAKITEEIPGIGQQTDPPAPPPPVSVKVTSLRDGKIGYTPYVRGSGPPYNLKSKQPLVLRFQTVLLDSLVSLYGTGTVARFKKLTFYYDGQPGAGPGTEKLDPGEYTVVEAGTSPDYGRVTMYWDGNAICEVEGSSGSSGNWVSIKDVQTLFNPSGPPGTQYHFTTVVEVTKPDGFKIEFGSDPVMINRPTVP